MKTKNIRLTFCRGDITVIVFVLLLAGVIAFLFGRTVSPEEGNMVVIYKEGEKIEEISLYQNREILVENGYTNKIVIKDKKVAIAESDCPGADCVYSGWISQAGRSLVCLPNRVEIRIEGKEAEEVDFIVR